MKNLILTIVSTLISLVAYSQDHSYDIIINLDDRIVDHNQIDRDISIIENAFIDWKQSVKDQYYIKSNGSFRVLVTDQKSMPALVNDIAITLQIDLSNVSLADKRRLVDDFEANLRDRIKSLYEAAYLGNNKNLYSGANLWKYFNSIYIDEIQRSPGIQNHIILLTDGYVDFESAPTMISKATKYSSTSFITSLRTLDWKDRIVNVGLMGCNIDLSDVTISIYELSPKVDFPYELQILKHIYNDWFMEMGALSVSTKGKTNTIKYASVR